MTRCFLEVAHGSSEYEATVGLRRRVLREPLGLDFTREELAAEAADYHLIANEDGTLAACLTLVPLENCVIKMRQVAVEPVLQKRGIGRELVRFAEDFALERGFTRIALNARTSAVPFYERLGYACVGEDFVEVTIPHRMMWKAL
jgi:N-acetylglutamate synthase-like GNAT family acetyltransferase